jgi:hypothetical protein
MSRRLSTFLAVGVIAAVAAGAVVALTAATSQSPPQPKAISCKAPSAAQIPATPAGARLRSALGRWPHGSVSAMTQLATLYPNDAVVQFYLGFTLICAGYDGDAVTALEAAKRFGADTPIRIEADNILHPQFFHPGYPIFVPLAPNPLLVQGSRLQSAGHQVSAEKLYARAASQAPDDAEAQVAAAVGRFDMDHLSSSFGRLGPLTKRFPRNQSVRYYLGLLLAWTGQAKASETEFQKTVALGPGTELGRDAAAFLSKLHAAKGASGKG